MPSKPATKTAMPARAARPRSAAVRLAQRAPGLALRPAVKLPSSAPVSPFVTAYLRFLSRVTPAEPDPADAGLEPNERALLEWVILRWAEQRPLTVRQAIAHTHLGSPATLHKRLIQLRQKSYLQIEEVPGDKRAKLLVPGVEGLAYLDRMGRHLMNTRRGPSAAAGAAKH